ncbi:dihydrofolate reductase family protein [Aeromicrobium sp. Leaf350]|uniref:dihydrofolate reductase family protein n=1 Tax=Aeromicrobium sp. Leaf350 TaxID=2876565 RepID=UPI001E589584|nr:dihydrofolate reductase family protein [Aeromicrobium sp. Leaf350]
MTSSGARPTPLRETWGPGLEGRSVDTDRLTDLYRWPDDRPWVRAMMATTLDGAAAGGDGVSGSVSSDADRLVFGEVRRRADAVLVGAGTLRAEEYTPMRAKDADLADRRAAGQLDAPVLVVVSRSLDLPWQLPVWAESTHPPVVVTDGSATPERTAAAHDRVDVVTLDDLAPQRLVEAVVGRGLPRIVCEGGPHLLRDLLAAGVVDEADITVSPMFVGTAGSPSTPLLSEAVRGELAGLLVGDDFLMARYLLTSS